MSTKTLAPLHPGEVLLEEFMRPMGISQNQLARDLKVPPRRINEIVNRKRGITSDTALRLARHFGTSAQFWMGLQADYDLELAQDAYADKIYGEVKVRDSSQKTTAA
ncbi:MAG: HigA family addiction module antidote protein [Desulfomonile tiedjei]|nr:HigA family addiction module antidote protein [Desulfomonile tiedjei]